MSRLKYSRGMDLARAAGDGRTLAQALLSLSFNLNIQSRFEEALPSAREAIEYAKVVGDRRLLAEGLLREAMSVIPTDLAQGRKLFDEAMALYTACDDPDGCCIAGINRGELEFQTSGDVQAALRFCEAALAIARTSKSRALLLTCLGNAAAYQVSLGEFEQARACARESLMVAREAQAWQNAAFNVQHLGAVALHNGDFRTAARLIGWTDARLKAIDEIRQTTEQAEYDRMIADLRAGLTAEQFDSFHAEGSMLTENAAYEEALSV